MLGDKAGLVPERNNLMVPGRVFLGEWMPGRQSPNVHHSGEYLTDLRTSS